MLKSIQELLPELTGQELSTLEHLIGAELLDRDLRDAENGAERPAEGLGTPPGHKPQAPACKSKIRPNKRVVKDKWEPRKGEAGQVVQYRPFYRDYGVTFEGWIAWINGDRACIECGKAYMHAKLDDLQPLLEKRWPRGQVKGSKPVTEGKEAV
jgi:hypothetical protein